MEKTIDGVIKAENIDPLLNLNPNTILRNNGQESAYLSGETIIDISDKQAKNIIENHIKEIKQQKNIKLQEILKPISIEVIQTGAMSPSIVPKPVVKIQVPSTPPVVVPNSSLPVKIVPPLPKPSVSGEVRIAPKPSVSGERIR
jgi:hypothetical protein